MNFGQNSRLRDALRCGGAAVVRLHFDGEHYVTLTGIDENDMVRVFDPYYLDQPLDTDGVQMVYDHPCEYNRLPRRQLGHCCRVNMRRIVVLREGLWLTLFVIVPVHIENAPFTLQCVWIKTAPPTDTA